MVTFKELFSSAYFWQLRMRLLLQYSVLLNPAVFQRGDGILALSLVQKVTSVEEIQRSQAKVKVTGTAHTFNAITDTPGTRLSLNLMPETVRLDAAACKVTVNAGIRYD